MLELKGTQVTNQIKSNLYPCAHCGESGTCRNGESESSCSLCIKRNELKGKGHSGIACGICGGLGQAEPMTERMNKRITPMLSLVIVFLLLFLIFWSLIIKSDYFNEVLAFASAVIGSVVGFYFSGNKNS